MTANESKQSVRATSRIFASCLAILLSLFAIQAIATDTYPETGAAEERWERPGSDRQRRETKRNVPDRDCSHFRTWRQAQDFYEASGPNDPHRLDADNDGVACEALR